MLSKNNVTYLNKIVSILSILLSSIGIIGNIVSFVICIKNDLRRVPTFVFMAFVSILNILKLITIGGCFLSLEYLTIEFKDVNNKFYNLLLVFIFIQSNSTIYLMVDIIYYFF